MIKAYELVYIKDVDTCPCRIYKDRSEVNTAFQMLKRAKKPAMLRGVDENGKILAECINGFNPDEMALTVKVDYGYGPKTFLAHMHYLGQYEVKLRSGKTQVVAVNWHWRTLESLEYEKIEHDFDHYVWFEDIVIRKVR